MLFTDIAINPTFAPEDVERVREQIVTGLRNSGDDPESNLQDLQNKNRLCESSIFKTTRKATSKTLRNLPPPICGRITKKIMQTSHLLLVIVGDLDAADIQQRVAATFGKLPRGNYEDQPLNTLSFYRADARCDRPHFADQLRQRRVRVAFDQRPGLLRDARRHFDLRRTHFFRKSASKRNLSYAPDADLLSLASKHRKKFRSARLMPTKPSA